jgi:hypothetical protein
MKMNIFNKTIWAKVALLPAMALSLLSCNESEFLNLKNPNAVTSVDFWKTVTDVEAAIATAYSPIRSQMSGYYGAFTGFQNMNTRADDTWGTVEDDPDTWQMTIFVNTPNNARHDFGRLYQSIQRANVVLDNIANVPMDESKRKELIAEASFIRGLNYFLLVTNYGEAPLRIKAAGGSSDDVMAPSVKEEVLWAQVEADFTAAKDLPLERSAEEAGRATKGAAIALLGKAYVFQEKFAEGEKELSALMQSPFSYDLMEKYEDNFREDTELNKESIFELCYDGKYGSGSWGGETSNSTQGMVLPNFIGPSGTGAWFKMMPTASLVDDFIAEERPAGSDTKFDKRMYTSFYFKHSDFGDVAPDETWFNDLTFDDMWVACKTKLDRGAPDFSTINGVKGRFLAKKYTNFWKKEKDGNSMYNQNNQNNNYRLLRFAEVVLLRAEAAIKLNKLDVAAADINRIRVRAGLPAKTFAGVDDLWAEMIHQKNLEFFIEGIRFFDLKRWYGYEGMKKIFVENKKQGAENFQPKHLVMPIPQGEVNTNTAIEQHPLWR